MAKGGWTRRPTGYVNVLESDVNKRLRAVALQALTGVIERSPVDTGAFRGNNMVSVGTPNNSISENAFESLPKGSTYGVGAFDDGFRIIGQVRDAFTTIYVQNNLPYADALENGNSRQAPQGIYAITFNDLRERNQ